MKIIIWVILFCTVVFAQPQGDQKIELPDFVITGKQNITFPIKYKIKPSLNFEIEKIKIKNTNSDVLLSQIDVSAPPEILPENNNQFEYLSGIIKLGAGPYTLPEGSLWLSGNSGNFILSGKLHGKNTSDYIKNAGYNNSGVNLFTEYTVGEQREFLPGLKFKLKGDYLRESYKFFASDSSGYKRNAEGGNAEFSISNYLDHNINYEFAYNKFITSINEIDLKENQDDFKVMVSGGVSDFTVKGAVKLSKINYYNDTLNVDSKLNSFSGSIITDVIPGMKLESGLTYYTNQSADRLKIFAEGEYYFGRGLTLYGRYNPKAYFITNRSFFEQNQYYFPLVPSVMLVNEENSFEAAIKFQYYTYVEFNAGVGYKNFSSIPYFVSTNGFFDVSSADDASESTIWGNALFHPGPYGQFYAGLTYGKTALSDGNNIPFEPQFSCDFNYSYEFDFKLVTSLAFKYSGSSFADTQNFISNPAISRLDLKLLYKLSSGLNLSLRFENLFNKKNYMFGLYEDKPVDIVAEVEFHW